MLSFFNLGVRPARTAPSECIYAIGDVHGRADLLKPMLDAIELDIERSERNRKSRIVFLGDIIDRGPESDRCMDMVIEAVQDRDAICLMGNHEQLLLDALLGDAHAIRMWMQVGGWQTLQSYSVFLQDLWESEESYVARLASNIKARHLEFLEGLPRIFISGDYAFVHAGLRPGIPIADQDPNDLLWIRKPFLETEKSFGPIVVHGHSVVNVVTFFVNRIAIDTQAWRTGRLSCIRLAGRGRRVYSAQNGVVRISEILAED